MKHGRSKLDIKLWSHVTYCGSGTCREFGKQSTLVHQETNWRVWSALGPHKSSSAHWFHPVADAELLWPEPNGNSQPKIMVLIGDDSMIIDCADCNWSLCNLEAALLGNCDLTCIFLSSILWQHLLMASSFGVRSHFWSPNCSFRAEARSPWSQLQRHFTVRVSHEMDFPGQQISQWICRFNCSRKYSGFFCRSEKRLSLRFFWTQNFLGFSSFPVEPATRCWSSDQIQCRCQAALTAAA